MKQTVKMRLALTDAQRAAPTILTRAQRVAIKRIYDRHGIWRLENKLRTDDIPREYAFHEDWPEYTHAYRLTYRQFRRRAVLPCYDTCVMVPWSGMWLGIETDGHTHS